VVILDVAPFRAVVQRRCAATTFDRDAVQRTRRALTEAIAAARDNTLCPGSSRGRCAAR
jgi:hypothetical protein